MKQLSTLCAVLFMGIFFAAQAMAHFGMVIPSGSMVMQQDPRAIDLTLSFSHPFEMIGMPLEKPAKFFVTTGGRQSDLKGALKETKCMGQPAWQASYPIKRPGLYTFCMEPAPYWEPAEDCFIIHYTKTVVAAFGDDEGWDEAVGLKTEIIPLSKPFGLYAGNVFQGIVKLDGQPVPYAQVEVEYYNRDKKAQAPSDYMITQTIKADGNGVFTYAAPTPGWWGFAALTTADFQIEHQGEPKAVELGAVLWVEFSPWN